jgi:hypothetical protein
MSTFSFRAAVSAAVLLAFANPSGAQSEDSERARRFFVEGQKEFELHNYDSAVEKLTQSNLIILQPRVYFALGQAYRMNHHCTDAVKAYRSFLSYSPTKTQARAAEMHIEECALEDPASVAPPKLAPTPDVAPLPPSIESAPTRVELTTAPPAKPTPVYKKWWLWTTVGVVVVGVGLGVGLGIGLSHDAKFNSTIPAFGPKAP